MRVNEWKLARSDMEHLMFFIAGVITGVTLMLFIGVLVMKK